MNERIRELAEQAREYARDYIADCKQYGYYMEYNELELRFEEKFAELIVKECLGIVKSNTYGPAGEYDYSYSDENAAADSRAEDIYKDITYHFGVEE